MANERIIKTHIEYIDPKNLFTEAEQIEQCCEPISADPCADVGKESVYDSADQNEIDTEALLKEARAKYPGIIINDVIIEDIGPDGPCGTMYETWEGRLNCCDEVELLVWEASESAEVLTDNSSGTIKISGGRTPYTVSVRGSGFYLDANHTIRDGTTVNPTITIYTADACGSAEITVSDGCSSVAGYVRSDNGQWIERYRNIGGGATGFDGCPVGFTGVSEGYGKTFEGITSKWKISQSYARAVVVGSAAFRPWSEITAQCAKYGDTPGWITDDMLSGACWTFEQTCLGCPSECVYTPWNAPNPGTDTISYDPGKHSWANSDCTATSGWCRLSVIWSYVGSTIIWEWVC